MLIREFLQAFQAGKELANAETWKIAQVRTNALVSLGMALVAIAGAFGYSINIDEDGVRAIAAAVGALLGLFNVTATVVSTPRVGLPVRTDSGPSAGGGDANVVPPEGFFGSNGSS